MGKIKDLFSKEKRVKTIAIIAGVVVVIAAIVCLFVFGPFNANNRIEKKLTNKMQDSINSVKGNVRNDLFKEC